MTPLEELEVAPFRKRKRYVGDYLKDGTLKDSQFPELANFMKITEKTIEKKNKQIRILRQELRRTKERLKTLESITNELQEKNLATDEVSEMILVNI